MTKVKRYHLTETGLVEGESLGRLSVVLAADFDAAVEHVARLVAERDALQQRLNAADERADTYLQILNAPPYYVDPGKHQTCDLDAYEWFRWNGEWRPINKHCLCDVLTKSGRLLFNQSPHDFNWDSEGEGDVVLAARHRGPMEGWGG